MQAGVARELAVLQAANPDIVLQSDDWLTLGSNGDEEFQLNDNTTGSSGLTSSPTFRMQIIDAGSMLNVNTASPTALALLPLTQDQIDCLLDWREAGLTARTDGAKDAYYNSLAQPYNTKLGNLTTVNELLLVKDWTTQTLYQPPSQNTSGTVTTTNQLPLDVNGNPLPLVSMLTVDSGSPNAQASGSARINFDVRPLSLATLARVGITGRLATTIAARAPYTSFAALLATPGMNPTIEQNVLNMVTFSTATRNVGKINLNTASQAVLETIPTVTTSMASMIATQQSLGFQTLGQLTTIAGIAPPQIAQLADNFTIGSDTWIVRVYGESGGVGEAEEVVVRQTNGNMQVINWDKINSPGIPDWWNWDAQTTTTVNAGSAQ